MVGVGRWNLIAKLLVNSAEKQINNKKWNWLAIEWSSDLIYQSLLKYPISSYTRCGPFLLII